MNEEINKIIDNLESCIGMFYYMITPIESNLLVSYIRELQQKYLNAVADYEQEKFNVEELQKQLENTINENNILDTKINEYIEQKNEWVKLISKFKNQQKEFIDYLENEINKIKEQIRTYDIWHEVGVDINFLILKKQFFIEILDKYKEIIGGKDER